MTEWSNGGLCECCWVNCIYCMSPEVFKYSTRNYHHPDTAECPATELEALKNDADNYRKNHNGFSREEITIELNDKPPHAPHFFTDAFTGGVKVTHRSGVVVVEEGNTYWEPLIKALIQLRELVGVE